MKRNWKIIYSDYSGPEKKAVDFLYKEMGAYLLRDNGRYTYYVLPCEKAENAVVDINAVIIGRYEDNKLIQKYIEKDEIKPCGYVVKIMDNPDDSEHKLVLITANESREVFYGAVDFIDDYMQNAFPHRDIIIFPDEMFEEKIPDYYISSAPAIKNRTIFTWTHPITDFRDYIDTAARNKINEIVFWNDYLPVNASEIVDYCHEYGIKVVWGYAWGWSRSCKSFDFENIEIISDEIVSEYENIYKDSGADAIYFQSFTEMSDKYIGDKLVAEAVTDFVNLTADKILKKHPQLELQFGLHATSVNDKLKYIKNVDKRVRIIWENCGSFPYSNEFPDSFENTEYRKTVDFTKEILTLRNNSSDGVLYKGFLTLDWEGDHFAHQSGPFVAGKATSKTIKEDRKILDTLWKPYQNRWIKYGKYCYDMTQNILSLKNDRIAVGAAAQLTNGNWFPFALMSQILWDGNEKKYSEIFEKVINRRSVDLL